MIIINLSYTVHCSLNCVLGLLHYHTINTSVALKSFNENCIIDRNYFWDEL